MPKLELIKNTLSHEQRIQNRINAFQKDIMSGDGDINYIDDVLIAVQNYLCEFEDADLQQASVKIREAIFYVDAFKLD